MSDDLTAQAAREAAKAVPPVLVTLYTLVSKGLPFIISLLTLTYLSIQIVYLLWKWWGEWQRKREIAAALRGDPPKHDRLYRQKGPPQ